MMKFLLVNLMYLLSIVILFALETRKEFLLVKLSEGVDILLKKKVAKEIILDEKERIDLGSEVALLFRKETGSIFIRSLEEAAELEKAIKENPNPKKRREFLRLIFSKMEEVEMREGKIKVPPSIIKEALS